MTDTSFWQWLFYAGSGLLVISFLPSKTRILVMIMIVLGGLIYLQKSGKSLNDLWATLQGKGS